MCLIGLNISRRRRIRQSRLSILLIWLVVCTGKICLHRVCGVGRLSRISGVVSAVLWVNIIVAWWWCSMPSGVRRSSNRTGRSVTSVIIHWKKNKRDISKNWRPRCDLLLNTLRNFYLLPLSTLSHLRISGFISVQCFYS